MQVSTNLVPYGSTVLLCVIFVCMECVVLNHPLTDQTDSLHMNWWHFVISLQFIIGCWIAVIMFSP